MKICIISNLYPPYARGGAEQVVHKIVEQLLGLGHTLVLITLTPRAQEKETYGNLTIYRIHPRNIFFYTDAHHHGFGARFVWHLRDIFNFDSRRKVKKILEEEKPDVVHTHNLMGLGFLIPELLRSLHLRHIHTIHDVQLVEPSGIILKEHEHAWRYQGFPTRVYTAVMRKFLGSPQVVISPSQFLLQFYEARGFFTSSKRIVMRNPVTLLSQSGVATKNEKFSFLYVGQIEEHKGVKFLVETFLEFVRDNPNCELHMVGSGSRLEELKCLAAENQCIVFHGKVDRTELPNIFESSDITVVPSLCYENSPTVIFESFLYSTPVLASNMEGIAELLRETENGLMFRAGDKLELLEKLQWCFDHRAQMAEMGKKGKEGIGDLSRETYLEKLVELYGAVEEIR